MSKIRRDNFKLSFHTLGWRSVTLYFIQFDFNIFLGLFCITDKVICGNSNGFTIENYITFLDCSIFKIHVSVVYCRCHFYGLEFFEVLWVHIQINNNSGTSLLYSFVKS